MRKALISICISLLLFTTAAAQESEEQIILTQLNTWRVQAGLAPLVMNPTLNAIAAAQADHLTSLGQIDYAHIHDNERGDNIFTRSQYADYQWPWYNTAEQIAVVEIAAQGNPHFAIKWWKESAKHTASITNPTYREIGIAARPMPPSVGGTMYIGVLGARPNVLTAVADRDGHLIHLTTEHYEWAGRGVREKDIFHDALDYRLLDINRQPLTEWDRFAPRVDLAGGAAYVAVRDTNVQIVTPIMTLNTPATLDMDELYVMDPVDNASAVVEVDEDPARAATELVVAPKAATELVVFAADAPTTAVIAEAPAEAVVVAPPEIPRPEETVLVSDAGERLLIISDDRELIVANPNDHPIDISDFAFGNADTIVAAQAWVATSSFVNLSALRPGECLRIYNWNDQRPFPAHAECNNISSGVGVAPNNMFWATGPFQVMIDGQSVFACSDVRHLCTVVFEA